MRDGPNMLDITPIPGRHRVPPKQLGHVEPVAGTPDAEARAVPRDDEVDASSAASFPASDPPSWWSGR